MRIIGSIEHENLASRFSAHLQKKGIENTCEPLFDAQTGYPSYQIWIHDEDRIEEASQALCHFQKHSSDPLYDPPVKTPLSEPDEMEPEEEIVRKFRAPFTVFIIGLCSLIFLFNEMQEVPMRKEGLSEQTFLITPLQSLFLFDIPPPIANLERVIEKYEIDPQKKWKELPPEVQRDLKAAVDAPYWRGVYDLLLLSLKGEDTQAALGPLFSKIREGQVWRLFSPALLHADLLHILFNMIWVWVLGRPIEERIGKGKTLLLSLLVGIGSNIAQYAMGGPLFLGYSGVVMGLAGFTWMREKIAPWEGYPMQRSTFLFLAFFLISLFALQLGSFLLQVFTTVSFAPNIANTAHIAGALLGASLARLPFFSWRVAP